MAMTIRTSDGDLLDSLCYAIYGNLNGTVEQVLNVNPGLGAQAEPFIAGLLIYFPDRVAPVATTIKLWS